MVMLKSKNFASRTLLTLPLPLNTPTITNATYSLMITPTNFAIPQWRAGNNRDKSKKHHSETENLEKQYIQKSPEQRHLTWLYIRGKKTDGREGFNPDIKEGTRKERENNPGTQKHFDAYQKLRPKLVCEGVVSQYDNLNKFRTGCKLSATLALKFCKEGKTIPNNSYSISIRSHLNLFIASRHISFRTSSRCNLARLSSNFCVQSRIHCSNRTNTH